MSTDERPDEAQQAAQSGARRSPNPGTSLTLLQRARAREPSAWDRLFYLYRPLVLYWCSCWGVRGEDADDVAQEVFRELTGGLDNFREDRPGTTFRGWLRGVTRNRVLMHHRRAARQEQAAGGSLGQQRLEQVADEQAADEDPAEQISALYQRALEVVRSEFEARTWQMFWQTVVDLRPPAAVAAEMGVSDAAVRLAKSRVLRRLKEEVGDLIQ